MEETADMFFLKSGDLCAIVLMQVRGARVAMTLMVPATCVCTAMQTKHSSYLKGMDCFVPCSLVGIVMSFATEELMCLDRWIAAESAGTGAALTIVAEILTVDSMLSWRPWCPILESLPRAIVGRVCVSATAPRCYHCAHCFVLAMAMVMAVESRPSDSLCEGPPGPGISSSRLPSWFPAQASFNKGDGILSRWSRLV